MNTSANTLPAAITDTKPLWAAIGVLGVAVVALGASLVYVQSRPVDGHVALAAISSNTYTLPSTGQSVGATESLSHQEDLVEPPKPPLAVVRPLPARPAARPAQAPVPVAAAPAQATAPVPAAAPAQSSVAGAATNTAAAPSPATDAPGVVTSSGVIPRQPQPARPTCANCGTVEAITPILEKKPIYQVQVRMDDGSLRTIEQGSAASVGAKVTLDGAVLRSGE